MITVVTTENARFHKPNLTLSLVDHLAKKMIDNGWAVSAEGNEANIAATAETTTATTPAVNTPEATMTKQTKINTKKQKTK